MYWLLIRAMAGGQFKCRVCNYDLCDMCANSIRKSVAGNDLESSCSNK
jgi:hypothetical protein|eukprot:COSAG03_NODE_565_length_6924_cov_22.096013_2_plen_48_part_00